MTDPGPPGDAVMVYLSDASGRILLIRARGLLDGHWMPPGGHIDPDELPEDAACRELAEELDLHCRPSDLKFLGQCRKDVGAGVLTLFTADRHSGSLQLGPEILEARWVDPRCCENLPTLPATEYGLRLLARRCD